MTCQPVVARTMVRCAAMLIGLTATVDIAAGGAEPKVAVTIEDLKTQLASSKMSDRERVDQVVAWARAATKRALAAPPQVRTALWTQLHEVKSVAQQLIDTPRGLLIDVQLALSTVARTNSIRNSATLSTEALAASRAGYRSAIAELLAVQDRVNEQLRTQYHASPRERRHAPWDTQELESLGRHLKVRLAQVYRQQAGCYAVGSTDRVNALTLALEQVDEIVALAQDEAIVWQARVEQIVCLRSLERMEDVRTQVERWQSMSPPPEVKAQLTAAARRPKPNDRPRLSRAAAQLEASAAHLAAIGVTAKRLRGTEPAPNSADLAAYVALLEEHLQKWPDERSADTARWWLARQLMSQRRWSDAAAQLSAIDVTCAHFDGALHALAECYGQQLSDPQDDRQRRAAAESLLQIVPTIHEREVEPVSLAKLFRYEAMSHEILGQRQSALAAYDRWRKFSPNNADAQEAYASWNSQSSNANDLRKALRDWQQIEKRSKPGGGRWRRARRARIAVLRQLGEEEQAEKLVKLTKILYPQLAAELEGAVP